MHAEEQAIPTFSQRQREVLDAVLALMVEEGDGLSTAQVARKARCSKESLYRWFGDRDGLLRATVQWQASRVKPGGFHGDDPDEKSLRKSLQDFAETWLRVVTSQTSIALNRVAISHAGSGKSNLGRIVLANGRFAIGERLKPVLEAGREAGLLQFEDTEEAFRCFFGLVARDVQLRVLLGDELRLSAEQISRDAKSAAERFLMIYATRKQSANVAGKI